MRRCVYVCARVCVCGISFLRARDDRAVGVYFCHVERTSCVRVMLVVTSPSEDTVDGVVLIVA